MGFRVQRKASPRVTSHPPKVPYTLQIYTFFHHVVNPSPLLEAPWCLAGCPIGSFRSPWCFPGAPQAAQLILSCVPGASQAVQLVLSCLPGASLVPLRLSKWSFPASLVLPCQRQSGAPSGLLKASLCYGQPAVGPIPGFAANRADRH